MVFHRNLNDNKSFQVSWTLLSILADLNNTVCIVSILYLISIFYNSLSKLLGTIWSAQTSISIIFIFIFLCFFSPLARSKYLSNFLFSFIFSQWSAGTAKYTRWQVLFILFFLFFSFFFFFFCCWLSRGLVFWLRLGDLFVSQNPREFYVSHFLRMILICVYTILLNVQISISFTFPSMSPLWLILYSFCACFQHPLV